MPETSKVPDNVDAPSTAKLPWRLEEATTLKSFKTLTLPLSVCPIVMFPVSKLPVIRLFPFEPIHKALLIEV